MNLERVSIVDRDGYKVYVDRDDIEHALVFFEDQDGNLLRFDACDYEYENLYEQVALAFEHRDEWEEVVLDECDETLDDHDPDEYIKGDKANGYTVTKAKKGFVIRVRSNHQGALTDGVYWLQYRSYLHKDVDLHAFINEDSPVTYGEWVFQHLPDRVLKSGRRVY